MFIFDSTNLHSYSFAVVGLNKKYNKTFPTRQAANKLMYELIAKYDLKLEEVWNDKHDKTYICNKGVSFYIQRA
jgi:predicted phosphoadenosine phosphosulfate sulfurtransferase